MGYTTRLRRALYDELNVGPGTNFYDSKSEFAPIVGVTLGFRLGSKAYSYS